MVADISAEAAAAAMGGHQVPFGRDLELRVEVKALDDAVRGLRSDLSDVRSTMATRSDFVGLTRTMEDWIRRFESQDSDRRKSEKVNWTGLVSVMIGAVIMVIGLVSSIGWITYSPIKEGLIEDKAELKILQASIVPRAEHTREWDRRDRELSDLRAQTVSNQKELVTQEVFRRSVSAIQRQLDEQRQAFGNTYSLRDALSETLKRVDRLERGNLLRRGGTAVD